VKLSGGGGIVGGWSRGNGYALQCLLCKVYFDYIQIGDSKVYT
jgi:hypothetical protein